MKPNASSALSAKHGKGWVSVWLLGLAIATSTSAHAGDVAQDSRSQVTVDPAMGSLRASVPISVPKFHGIEPHVDLVYSSGAGNGLLGVGWNIGAASSIARVGRSKTVPTFTAADLFVLDGNPLMPLASAPASSACKQRNLGTHCGMQETYTKIEYSGVAPNDSFTVTQRDGVKYRYGASAASKVGGTSGTYRWNLDQIQDPRGNTVTFSYWCDTSVLDRKECYLDSIDYNGSSIKLYRELRPDPITYTTGSRRVVDWWAPEMGLVQYRIKSIGVWVGGALARAYSLKYEASEVRGLSRLISVQQFGADATLDQTTVTTGAARVTNAATASSFPAFALTYSPESGTFAAPVISTDASNVVGYDTSIADVTGDNQDDVIATKLDATGWSVRTRRSIGGGAYAAAVTSYTVGDFSGVGMASVVDLNNDGARDLVAARRSGTTTQTTIYVRLSNRDGTYAAPTITTVSCGTYGPYGGANVGFADSTLDGVVDLIVAGHQTACVFPGASNAGIPVPGGTGAFAITGIVTSLQINSTTPDLIDLNGDGILDLRGYLNETYFVLFGARDGSGTFVADNYAPEELGSTPVDLNGDQALDFIYSDLAGPNTTFSYLGDGTSLVAAPLDVTDPTWPASNIRLYGDVNGDHLTDLIRVIDGSAYTRIGRGDGSFTASIPSTTPAYAAGYTYYLGDQNGDGMADLIASQPTASGWTLSVRIASGSSSASNKLPNLVESVRNGIGGETSVGYKPSSSWLENGFFPALFPTVYTITIADGRGDVSTAVYNYEGGLWDPKNRVPLGYRRVTTTLAATGAYSESYYWQRVGSISKPEVVYQRNALGQILRFTKMGFSQSSAPPYESPMTEMWNYECNGGGVVDANNNYLGGCRRSYKQMAYDIYANMTLELVYGDYDLTGAAEDGLAEVRAFAPNTGAYIVSYPIYEETRACAASGMASCASAGTLMARAELLYDGATAYTTPPTRGGMTTKRTWNSNTGGYVTSTMGYDAYGNATTKVDPIGRTVTTGYDPTYHVYPVTETGPSGSVSITWSYLHGAQTGQTDLYGSTSTMQLDALGRLYQTNAPDGQRTGARWINLGNPTTQYVRKMIWDPTQGTTGGWSNLDSYFDGVGRTYKVVNAQGLIVDTLYGASGKVAQESLPHSSGASARWILHTYDELGRKLAQTEPDGVVQRVAYANGVITRTDPLGAVTTEHQDLFGRVTKTTVKKGGTVYATTHTFDVLGRPLTDTDSSNLTTTRWFDSLGNKLQVTDPDRGTIVSTYDAAGHLLTERDALNQTTTDTLDAAGRTTKRTHPDGSFDRFVYDQSGTDTDGFVFGTYGRGRLTSTISASGVVTKQRFDIAGRTVAQRKVIDGTAYDSGAVYDGLGRLKTTTYPDGDWVTNVYGTSGVETGQLKQVIRK